MTQNIMAQTQTPSMEHLIFEYRKVAISSRGPPYLSNF